MNNVYGYCKKTTKGADAVNMNIHVQGVENPVFVPAQVNDFFVDGQKIIVAVGSDDANKHLWIVDNDGRNLQKYFLPQLEKIAVGKHGSQYEVFGVTKNGVFYCARINNGEIALQHQQVEEDFSVEQVARIAPSLVYVSGSNDNKDCAKIFFVDENRLQNVDWKKGTVLVVPKKSHNIVYTGFSDTIEKVVVTDLTDLLGDRSTTESFNPFPNYLAGINIKNMTYHEQGIGILSKHYHDVVFSLHDASQKCSLVQHHIIKNGLCNSNSFWVEL